MYKFLTNTGANSGKENGIRCYLWVIDARGSEYNFSTPNEKQYDSVLLSLNTVVSSVSVYSYWDDKQFVASAVEFNSDSGCIGLIWT